MKIRQAAAAAMTVLLLYSLGGMAVADTAAAGSLRAGAAVADITPKHWPLPMVGSFSERLATQAWDPLMVRALVLDDGRDRVGFVLVDSCYLPRELCDAAKQRASEPAGLRVDRILISATHSHTAPASRDRREIKADSGYVEQVAAGHRASSDQSCQPADRRRSRMGCRSGAG